MRKTSVHILSLLIITWAATATAAGVSKSIARMLDRIDPADVPTGILYDRVLSLSQIDRFDGSPAAPAATAQAWRQMLHELTRASYVPLHWPSPQEARGAEGPGDAIPIAVIDAAYNRFRRDALADGALTGRAGALEIVPGRNPFERRRVVAATALDDVTYRGGDVSFVLQRRWFLTPEGPLPNEITIDCDDGDGARELVFGEPVRARYHAAGEKRIEIQLRYDGHDAPLTARFRFEVAALQAPLPHDTMFVTASIPYNAEFGTAEAYVYRSDANATLTDPIIVVEGFDIDNSLNWDELYEILNKQSLIETIRADGYDAVVLNFTEGTDPIQKNSFVVVELIQQVQAMIDPSTDIAVVGASMGGLCARYALAYMEANALPHRARTFLAFDSPQRGANIPLGIQYWLFFFQGESAEAAYQLERLSTPAARQMLVYSHTDPPGATGEADPLRAAFVTELDALGYPANSRNVAIANGSGVQANQGFNAGDQVVQWEYDSFLVDITGNVWAVPDDAPATMIFDGEINPILVSPTTLQVTVSGTRPYDNAPGGWRATMADMDSVDAPYGDIVALHNNHCFIPTVSALDLDTTDVFYDIAGDPNILSLTPFDAVYFPGDNQEHVDVTAENAQWFLDEVERDVTGAETGPQSRALASLGQNYPNPFNPRTTIAFTLARPAHVRLDVFDASGRRVITLLDGRVAAGRRQVSWNGRDRSGGAVSSGVYFYRLAANGVVRTRKMVLVK